MEDVYWVHGTPVDIADSYVESTPDRRTCIPVSVRTHIYTRECLYSPRMRVLATPRKGGRRHESASESRHFCVYFIVHILRTVLRQAAQHTRTRVKPTPTQRTRPSLEAPGRGGGELVARSEGIATRGWARSRERKSEERSVWRGRRRWRGELDFSDSKFCSSLFPAPRAQH